MLTDNKINVVPITEKAIRELLNHAAFSSASIALDPRDITQLCTRVLEAEANLRVSETRESEKVEALRARVKVLEDALGGLMHAVCGETGFAECVRRDSGKAYPWPALEIAEDAARKAIAITGKQP